MHPARWMASSSAHLFLAMSACVCKHDVGRSSWQWLHVIWCHIKCNPDNKSSCSTLVAWLCTFWGTSQ